MTTWPTASQRATALTARERSAADDRINDTAASLSAHPSRRMVWALCGLALALGVAWLPVHLTLPLGHNTAVIGLVAERLLDGLWPYADSWDHRGPVAYALFAAAIWICGDVRLGICVGDLFFIGVAAFALRSISRSLDQPWLAPIGAIVLVLATRDAQSYGHPDQWLAAIWLWVIAGLLHPVARNQVLAQLLAGLAIGVMLMNKPTSLPLLALPLLAALRARSPSQVAAVLIGCAAPIGAVVVVFDAGDRLPELLDAFVAFNFVAHAGPAGDSIPLALARFVVTAVAPWFDVGAAAITVAAVLGLRALWRRDRDAGRLVAVAWLLGLACVLLQGRSAPHHFAFANVVVALCTAYALSCALHWLAAAAAQDRQELSLPLVTAGAIAIAGISLAVQVHVAHAANWWSARLGLITMEAHEAAYCREDHCPAETRLAAELIRRETDRNTPIFLFGSDAGLYVAAGRPAATRFLSTRPLVSGPPAWRGRLLAQALATLRASPPHFIVVQDYDDPRGHRRLTSRQHLDHLPELRAFIAERYELAHNTGRFAIYRLKSAVMAGASRGSAEPADG